MADADVFIGIDHGKDGFKHGDFTIQGTAPSTDFYFKFSAVDGNDNKLSRKDAVIALEAIERVLESGALFTDQMNR